MNGEGSKVVAEAEAPSGTDMRAANAKLKQHLEKLVPKFRQLQRDNTSLKAALAELKRANEERAGQERSSKAPPESPTASKVAAEDGRAGDDAASNGGEDEAAQSQNMLQAALVAEKLARQKARTMALQYQKESQEAQSALAEANERIALLEQKSTSTIEEGARAANSDSDDRPSQAELQTLRDELANERSKTQSLDAHIQRAKKLIRKQQTQRSAEKEAKEEAVRAKSAAISEVRAANERADQLEAKQKQLEAENAQLTNGMKQLKIREEMLQNEISELKSVAQLRKQNDETQMEKKKHLESQATKNLKAGIGGGDAAGKSSLGDSCAQLNSATRDAQEQEGDNESSNTASPYLEGGESLPAESVSASLNASGELTNGTGSTSLIRSGEREIDAQRAANNVEKSTENEDGGPASVSNASTLPQAIDSADRTDECRQREEIAQRNQVQILSDKVASLTSQLKTAQKQVATAKHLIGKQRGRRQELEARLRAYYAVTCRMSRASERGALRIRAISKRIHRLPNLTVPSARLGSKEADSPKQQPKHNDPAQNGPAVPTAERLAALLEPDSDHSLHGTSRGQAAAAESTHAGTTGLWGTLAAGVATVAEMAAELNGPVAPVSGSRPGAPVASDKSKVVAANVPGNAGNTPLAASTGGTRTGNADSRREVANPDTARIDKRKTKGPVRETEFGQPGGASKRPTAHEKVAGEPENMEDHGDSTDEESCDGDIPDVARILKMPVPDPASSASDISAHLDAACGSIVAAVSAWAAEQAKLVARGSTTAAQKVESLRLKSAKHRELYGREQTRAVQLRHELEEATSALEEAEAREQESGSMLFRARNSELKLSMEFSQEVDSLRASLTSAREEVADYRDRIIFARRAESELQRQHAEATEAATKAKELHSSDALALEARVEAHYATRYAVTMKAAFDTVKADAAAEFERGRARNRFHKEESLRREHAEAISQLQEALSAQQSQAAMEQKTLRDEIVEVKVELQQEKRKIAAAEKKRLVEEATTAAVEKLSNEEAAARKRAADAELLRIIHAYGINAAVAQQLQQEHHVRQERQTSRGEETNTGDATHLGTLLTSPTTEKKSNHRAPNNEGHGMLFTPLRPAADPHPSGAPSSTALKASIATPMSTGISRMVSDDAGSGSEDETPRVQDATDVESVDVEELLLENHRLHMKVQQQEAMLRVGQLHIKELAKGAQRDAAKPTRGGQTGSNKGIASQAANALLKRAQRLWGRT